MQLAGLWQLMRFHKPIGIWLLLWPTWQAAIIANQHQAINWRVFAILTLGVIVMRAVGCVVNDLCDIKFDKQVARTKNRPLVSGRVSIKKAYCLVFIGLLLALLLVLKLPVLCFYLAICGVLLVVIYPLSKRWFGCPQMFLGLAFGLMPVLITFAAFNGNLANIPLLFCLASTLWPIAYDTLYAMADKKDDLKLKIYSSAKLLGDSDWLGVVVCYVLWLSCWFCLAWQGQSFYLFASLIIAIGLFVPKLIKAKFKCSIYCFQAFLFNAIIGGVIFIGLWLDRLMR